MNNDPRRDERPYLFGDTDLAGARLDVLARAFAPSSREFLERFVSSQPAKVCDVGCGPGFTTRLLAEVFPCSEIVGVDSSELFVRLAEQTPQGRVSYAVADATAGLPCGPYDLIYCRYVLTHIADCQAAIGRWVRSLAPNGQIAIEETDWIQTQQRTFAKYLDMVESMLAGGGCKLYIGKELDQVRDWPGLERAPSELAPISISDREVAQMFSMNLIGFRRAPQDSPAARHLAKRHSTGELDILQSELHELAARDDDSSSITFGRRRLVLRKRE